MNRLPVLIVDDEELDRYLLTRDLKKTGYDPSITECSDGEQAAEFLAT